MAEIIRNALAQRVTYAAEAPRPLYRPIDAPKPYPVNALGPLRAPTLAIHAHTKAPVAICAQAVLGAVALVVQGHADVVLPMGQAKPCSLFLLTIAPSGDRKSAADSLALGAIYEYEGELRDRHRADTKVFEQEHAIWEAKLAEAKTRMKSNKGRQSDSSYDGEADLRAIGLAPEPPLTPVLVCTEPTFEGYCKLIAHGHPALGLFSAEGGSFIGGFGMSKDQKLKTAAGISSVWDGDPIKRVRAGDGSTVLAGRRLSLHLMAQPEVADQLLGDDLLVSQGLLSRLLVAAPESTAGTRLYCDPPEEARADLALYRRRLAALVAASCPIREGTRNELMPRALPLDPEARQIWISFHDHIEMSIGKDGELSPISGLANKAPEHAARLAALLTLWRDLNASAVRADEMANATNLMQFYLAEALRLRGAAAINPKLRLAQRVLDWLLTRWPEPAVHPAAIYNDCPFTAVRDQKAAREIIAILEGHGWLIRSEGCVVIKGRQRKEAWLIHGRNR